MEKFNKELIEKFGGIAMEKQLFFSDIVGKMNWNVDVNAGEISFGSELAFPMQVLGTFSHSSESWLWSWANTKSGLPAKIINLANQLKKYGEKNKIDFLTESSFEIERDDMHYIGLIGLGLSESNGYYLGNYGAGTMCLTIESKEIENKFPNDHISIFRTFPQLISQFEINHKETFLNYLNQKGYEIEESEGEVIGISGNGKVQAKFDKLERLTNLESIT